LSDLRRVIGCDAVADRRRQSSRRRTPPRFDRLPRSFSRFPAGARPHLQQDTWATSLPQDHLRQLRWEVLGVCRAALDDGILIIRDCDRNRHPGWFSTLLLNDDWF